MKLLMVLCLVGIAATTDLLQQAAPAVDENVAAFAEGAAEVGSMAQALETEDPLLDKVSRDIEAGLAALVGDAARDMLRKIEDHVDNSRKAAQDLFDKVKELKEKFGDGAGEKSKEMIANIRAKAKEALRNILQRLGMGKRNLDDSMDQIARYRFQDLVDLIKEKVVSDENIHKIREYIKNLPGDNPLVRAVKDRLSTLSDRELVQLIRELLETGNLLQQQGERWDKLKDIFKDKSTKFGKWVRDMWGKGLDKLKDKYGAIKAIAMEFISNSKDMSSEMSREALEFFRPHKEDLGSLWNKLVEATREAIGRF